MKFNLMSMSMSSFFLVVFVLLAMILLGMLPSSGFFAVREGMDAKLEALVDPTAHANEITNAELTKSVHILSDRLTLLEKSVNDSKAKIAAGEAQANAAVGNLQATLPS